MADDDPNPKKPHLWQPRFGLAAMLMVMLICCIMAAAAYYLVKTFEGGTSFRTTSLIMAMVAPAALVVLFSLLKAVFDWIRRSRRR
jgi:hypothetical protein